MLNIDSKASYGRLAGGDFSMQDEMQILKIIYAATGITMGGFPVPEAADLKARLSRDEKDTVRLLSDIHTSDADQRPHLTLLYTQPANQQQIIHIVVKFNSKINRWEYQATNTARTTGRPRNITNGKDVPWSWIEMVGKMR